jgi:hypothetical protein
MKITILKLSVLLLCIISVTSCKKRERKFRFYGYIYNSIDSTPFKNTHFKLWEKGSTYSQDHETPFTTDVNGYFDLTNDGKNGVSVTWPSFCYCASYLGPALPSPKPDFLNSDGTLQTIFYDTIYTTPYH